MAVPFCGGFFLGILNDAVSLARRSRIGREPEEARDIGRTGNETLVCFGEAVLQHSDTGQGPDQAGPDRRPGLVARLAVVHGVVVKLELVVLVLVAVEFLARLRGAEPRAGRFGGKAGEEAEEEAGWGGLEWVRFRTGAGPIGAAVQPLRSPEDAAVANRAAWGQDAL